MGSIRVLEKEACGTCGVSLPLSLEAIRGPGIRGWVCDIKCIQRAPGAARGSSWGRIRATRVASWGPVQAELFLFDFSFLKN